MQKKQKPNVKRHLQKPEILQHIPETILVLLLMAAAKYVKKVEYDNKTGEILTASSILDIDEDRILEEEALDGYYVLVTSEMERI